MVWKTEMNHCDILSSRLAPGSEETLSPKNKAKKHKTRHPTSSSDFCTYWYTCTCTDCHTKHKQVR